MKVFSVLGLPILLVALFNVPTRADTIKSGCQRNDKRVPVCFDALIISRDSESFANDRVAWWQTRFVPDQAEMRRAFTKHQTDRWHRGFALETPKSAPEYGYVPVAEARMQKPVNTPEPESLALLALGLTALSGWALAQGRKQTS